MRIHSAGVLSAALVAGMAGSVAAYRSQITEAPAAETTTTTAVVQAPQPVKPRTRIRWAPCPKGSQLEAGACVTDVVRTVVVPPAPVNVPAPVTPVSTVGAPTNGHQDEGDVGYDDRGEDDRDEDGQDEHGQDDDGQAEHGQDEDGQAEHEDDEHEDDD